MAALLQPDKRSQQLRKLTEVSRALTYAMSLDEVLKLAVERAAELLAADKAVLMLTNDEGLLCVRASHGLDESSCEKFREPLHETLISRLQGLLGQGSREQFLGVPLVVSGEVLGLLAVARPGALEDVEEEEWLLSALADQAAVALEKTRLDETAEFRERLIGIVSHDLRNPISAILLSASTLLRREELDERTIKAAVRIQASAERAGRMIRDLLDFTQARLGAGIRVSPQPTDLHAVVRQVVEELEAAHPERIRTSQHGDAHGSWDVDRISQVVGNLLTNALQYSPPGSLVQIETRGEAGRVTLSVHNEGEPIGVARLADLFQPMHRASPEINQASRSVGLGLYIVKHIVERHEGSVTVQSNQPEGTTFLVSMPRESPFKKGGSS